MSKPHKESADTIMASLQLTSMPPFCGNLENTSYQLTPPVSSVSDSSTLPLEFFIKGKYMFFKKKEKSATIVFICLFFGL